MYDPCIGNCDYIAEEVVAYPYVEENNNMLAINSSYLATLKAIDESCGYAAYRDQYLTFPASGVQPPVPDYGSECEINGKATDAAFKLNPCLNSYEINTQCPIPSGMSRLSTWHTITNASRSTGIPHKLGLFLPRSLPSLFRSRRRQNSHARPTRY